MLKPCMCSNDINQYCNINISFLFKILNNSPNIASTVVGV